MATEAWPLRGPSLSLITLLRACPSDPTEEMKVRLSHMLHEFVQHHGNHDGTKELAEKCCCEAEERYFSILETLLSEEIRSPGGGDLSETLWKDPFQRYLVVLCLEFAISANQLPCDFTKLLQIFKLDAYRVPLVIELMLGSGFGQSHAVIKHLTTVEYKILESLAWTGDSPLWKEIEANEGGLPSSQQAIPPTQLEETKRTDLQPEPGQPKVHVGLEMSPSVSVDQRRSSSTANTPKRKNPLSWFACKVYKLMTKRLSELCSKLNIPDALRLNIWTCFEHSLVRYARLMVDRHLDEMLLFAIHYMAKVTNTKLTFNSMANCYKSQPFANERVYEDMLILESVVENRPTEANDSGDHRGAMLTPCTPSGQEEKDEVFRFYQAYSMKMQRFAKQFAPTFGGETPPQSPYPILPLPKKSAFSHPRLVTSHIFISPLRETISPVTTGLCYNFGSSPPERLREINNKIGNSHAKARYAVSFDTKNEEEEGEGGPSSKRPCLDDQSALERRLKSVVNDRAKIGNQDQA
ncbi:retinoblastoma-like protein 2 isoform 1-T3 [Odontesthes bonariensis]|uniref:retinoblastoma-like protein 2 n=1 Tax=Odontesthes bonariensis TaxID=219752 RepID=UPI003F5896DF